MVTLSFYANYPVAKFIKKILKVEILNRIWKIEISILHAKIEMLSKCVCFFFLTLFTYVFIYFSVKAQENASARFC